ncbi:hypothetical protein LCGC14_2547230 [marine sediment metagenome]|uniref:Uncharacterized protein n=1 Tax=marine sediment metagenome TaxID=412755 RepID=A0A0F9D0E8_9ZZZZ
MTRYFIFHDASGQIQASQSSPNPPDLTVWETKHGYIRKETDAETFAALDRDTKLTFAQDGEILAVTDSPNPIQPTPNPKAVRVGELTAKLMGDIDLTNKELNELARLEYSL